MAKTILISAIDDSDRLRPVDPAHAELLAASIEATGMMQPIVVRSSGDGFKLTAGANRLAALKLLGWERLTIGEHVIIREEVSDAAAKIAEIDENLARYDLNALDRAVFIAKRRQLYEETHSVAGHGGDRRSPKIKKVKDGKSPSWRLEFTPRFTKEVAEKTGLGERTVQRACYLASQLDIEAIASLRGTPIENNQNELLQLAAIAAFDQRKVASFVKSGEAKTVTQAKVAAGLSKPEAVDPQARLYAALLDSWNKATKQTRAQFLADIGAEMSAKAKKAAD